MTETAGQSDINFSAKSGVRSCWCHYATQRWRHVALVQHYVYCQSMSICLVKLAKQVRLDVDGARLCIFSVSHIGNVVKKNIKNTTEKALQPWASLVPYTFTFRAFSRHFCPEWLTTSTFVKRKKPQHITVDRVRRKIETVVKPSSEDNNRYLSKILQMHKSYD